ncbi:MAG: hypothetical protein JOZ04_04745 [Acidimicrobiia bacterium]|nr:hypothetical protein [Acidimicrobiia bacterium]
MAGRQVVVDGSNIATEGRSLPSLAQLDDAVRAYQAEHPDDKVIVVVDATFGHRIDQSERRAFEEAEAAGELVSPPAGAIGRGDRFLLQIADRTGATVLSNDSFQEFHGEYGWLFDEGRLIGGKPVQGVGWIFTPRTPVRGPKSRVAVRAGKRAAKAVDKKVSPEARDAIAEATADAVSPKESRSRRRRGRGRGPAEPVNEPLAFITFIADHQPGSEVEAIVDSFTSHGAFVTSNGARCYVPLTGLGDPPPRSAKDVLRRGEPRAFVVQALDPPRRGIELALPEVAKVAGVPTDETVEAEIAEAVAPAAKRKAVAKKKAGRAKKKAAPAVEEEAATGEQAALLTEIAEGAAPSGVEARKAPAKKAPAKQKAATKATAKKATAKKAVPAKKKALAKDAKGKVPAKKEPSPAKKKASPAKKKAAVKKATAKKASEPKKATKKAAATRTASKKSSPSA